MKIIKQVLKKTIFYKIYRKIYQQSTKSFIDILYTFGVFVPASGGDRRQLTMLTIDNINSHLGSFKRLITGSPFDVQLSNEFKNYNKINSKSTLHLSNAYKEFGSDKSTIHDYHLIYSYILNNLVLNYNIFEIGLGTNNKDVVSNMGESGSPGASLKAFKKVFQNAKIFGADVDKRILFNEDRIKTFYIDQTDIKTFDEVNKIIEDKFDLMIDDGLHSLSANLNSLHFFMKHLKVGGYIVIEDIPDSIIEYWAITSNIISPDYISTIIKTKAANIFLVKKVK